MSSKITDFFQRRAQSNDSPSSRVSVPSTSDKNPTATAQSSRNSNHSHKSGSNKHSNDTDITDDRKPKGKDDRRKNDQRSRLRQFAAETISAMEKGSYTIEDGTTFDLTLPIQNSTQGTSFFSPDCFLKNWPTQFPSQSTQQEPVVTQFSVIEITTLQGASLLWNTSPQTRGKIGILNFASAKKEGGGFLSGAQAQEESIARASTLYPSLLSKEAQKFYKLHKADPHHCFYTHAMIHTPQVLIIRDDNAKWHQPVEVDVVTSAAVNAGVVMRNTDPKDHQMQKLEIRRVMRERMARILFLFEHKGAESVVLGSFGTGVFRNDVDVVASLWGELLGPEGRFGGCFKKVVFAVIGRETFEQFKYILGPLEGT